MHTQYFTIFVIAILFNFMNSVASCEVDTDCPVGFVCSSTPSTQGQCIYGCHTNDNCRIDASDTQNQTCDKNLPRWSCTCGNDTVCDGDGTCVNGHCVFPFINFSGKGILPLCGLSALESAFDDVLHGFCRSTNTHITDLIFNIVSQNTSMYIQCVTKKLNYSKFVIYP